MLVLFTHIYDNTKVLLDAQQVYYNPDDGVMIADVLTESEAITGYAIKMDKSDYEAVVGNLFDSGKVDLSVYYGYGADDIKALIKFCNENQRSIKLNGENLIL